MNFKILVFLVSSIIAGSSLADELTIQEKINQLNQATIETIGVSLHALSYLIDASEYSYMPLRYLQKSGDIEYVKELEKAGYVRMVIHDELPYADTEEKRQKQVQIIPLYTGVEIQRGMLALKNNN